MARTQASIAAVDPVWTTIRSEAEQVAMDEPLMASLVHAGVLHHSSLERALSYRVAQKLSSPEMSELILREIADEAYQGDPQLGVSARADILAVFERDPACHRYLQPLLFFKGFQALQCYRIGHWLWLHRRRDMAYFIQMRTSEVFGVDIHPGARVGNGIMIDHAHSIVIGETAVVGNNVSMLHSVTLGGTGKEDGDRHPKIGDGVLIGAGDARYLAWTGLVNLAAYVPLAIGVVSWPGTLEASVALALVTAAFAIGYLAARAVTLGLRARGARWMVTGTV